MNEELRIFVTGHSSRHGGGISVAKNLIMAMGRVAPQNRYFFSIPEGLGFEECCQNAPKHQFLAYRHGSMVKRWLWESFQLPRIVNEFQPHVIFNIANRGFLDPPAPQATLVQDPHLFYEVVHFGRITHFERVMFWYHRRHLRRSLLSTSLLLCQTPVAAQRLRRLYGDNVRIVECPNHPSKFLNDDARDNSLPDALEPLRGRYLLFCLTRYYSHKNLEILLDLFTRHADKMADVTILITITPEQHPHACTLLQRIQRMGLQEHIVNVKPLRQEELGSYYHNCDALFLPTLLESFSGTYLEAMHYGCPILTSDMDFAHGVCGDAALYFDPLNPGSIADAIVRLKSNPSLQQDLIRRGKHRLGQNSQTWDEIAVNVTKALESIAMKACKVKD